MLNILGRDRANDRARAQELEKQKKRVKKDNTAEIRHAIDVVTAPLVTTVFRSLPISSIKLRRKLHVVGLGKYFQPFQWLALSAILAAAGVFLFLLFWSAGGAFLGIIMFVFLAIGPNFLLNNAYNNRTEILLQHFPETIRVLSGYLSCGIILTEAVRDTARASCPEWKRLLEMFSTKCETESVTEALEWIKTEVDIMEAREFFSVVRLTIDLGNSVRDGFVEQAELIQTLLRDAMQKKIEKRKVLATVVQFPLFIITFALFGLPIVGTFIDLFA